jgi:membrane protein implicated in regulation of membrane protease activity
MEKNQSPGAKWRRNFVFLLVLFFAIVIIYVPFQSAFPSWSIWVVIGLLLIIALLSRLNWYKWVYRYFKSTPEEYKREHVDFAGSNFIWIFLVAFGALLIFYSKAEGGGLSFSLVLGVLLVLVGLIRLFGKKYYVRKAREMKVGKKSMKHDKVTLVIVIAFVLLAGYLYETQVISYNQSFILGIGGVILTLLWHYVHKGK